MLFVQSGYSGRPPTRQSGFRIHAKAKGAEPATHLPRATPNACQLPLISDLP